MVSLNTIITIGGLGAAYLIFSRLGGGAGIGSAIGSQIGDFTGALGSGLTQAVNRFGNLVETPQANEPPRYRLDPTETRDYDEYVNYNDPTPTPTVNPPFLFPNPPAQITPPPVIQYGSPLPPFAGDLEYVVNTNFPNARKATAQEKSYLQSFGIGL
jgi:hypothetical protein|tara:strand:+ start:19 stop:489 length:471 start_codon:yes stop_codon:yes gene_type:complete